MIDRIRAERLVRRALPYVWPGALLALSVGFCALALAAELQPLPTINDGNNHFLFVRRADEALSRGEHLLDHWVPQMEAGFPEFFYYQHLPHLVVVALGRITFGLVDLFTLFNLVRFILFVTFPLTVFWSMRVMGFRPMAAAFGGAAAPLLSGAFNFGLEYDSYVWIGYGMYTQLWASHLVFVTIALVHRALATGRGHAAAILVFAALSLTHLAYAYMAAITTVVLLVLARPAQLRRRALGVVLIGTTTALATSYMTLPFVLERDYLEISPSLPRFRWDSFGAEQVLTWLVQGRLFDAGRLPVLTILVGVGAVVALIQRTRPALVALAVFAVWLVLYFGRPTLGALADLLPLREGVPMHRFIAMVQLGGILLIGVAGGALADVAARARRRAGPAAAAVALGLLLLPALGERATFFAGNAELMTRSRNALTRDADAQRILDDISASGPGRVYAGLRANWGERMLNLGLSFRSLRLYDLVTFNDLWPVAPPYYSWSLNSDIMFFFDESDPGHYDVFAVRYAVTPFDVRLPAPMRQVRGVGPYVLWELPGASFARFVGLSERVGVATQAELIERNVRWLRSDGPATGRYIRYDFPAPAKATPVNVGGCPSGSVRQDVVGPARFEFTVECATAATLVIKTSYHPNWTVRVDDRVVPTFMMSPAFIGIGVPAGRHTVTAEYLSHPLKTPLALVGLVTVLAAIVFRRRIDQVVTRLGEPAPQRDKEQQPREHEDERLAEEPADHDGEERDHEERDDPAAPHAST